MYNAKMHFCVDLTHCAQRVAFLFSPLLVVVHYLEKEGGGSSTITQTCQDVNQDQFSGCQQLTWQITTLFSKHIFCCCLWNSVEFGCLCLTWSWFSFILRQKFSFIASNVKVCEKGLVTLHVRFKKVTHTLLWHRPRHHTYLSCLEGICFIYVHTS